MCSIKSVSHYELCWADSAWQNKTRQQTLGSHNFNWCTASISQSLCDTLLSFLSDNIQVLISAQLKHSAKVYNIFFFSLQSNLNIGLTAFIISIVFLQNVEQWCLNMYVSIIVVSTLHKVKLLFLHHLHFIFNFIKSTALHSHLLYLVLTRVISSESRLIDRNAFTNVVECSQTHYILRWCTCTTDSSQTDTEFWILFHPKNQQQSRH